MTLLQLSFKNLFRAKIRTLLTFASILVATIVVWNVLSLNRGYKLAVEEELVKKSGIHLYITKEGCPMEAASVIVQGGASPQFVGMGVIDTIKKIKAYGKIKEILPFAILALTTPDGSRTDIFFGTTEAIQRIKPTWKLRGSWFKDTNSIILGATIARKESREIGDKIYFEQFDREFEVVGILEPTYTQDDGTFFLDLPVLLKLFSREGKLSGIGIQLVSLEYLEEVKRELREQLPAEYFILPSETLSKGVLTFFGSTRAIMFVMVVIGLVMCIFAIMNTFLMSILERRKEFGYLKCVGAGAGDIMRLILLETLLLVGTGTASGLGVGSLFLPVFETYIRRFLVAFVPVAKIVRPNLFLAFITIGLISGVGLLSALHPAVKAGRATPMEVIRNE
jgi:putative ABC transport system permease protein